ncbi:MAG TPA: alkyl sulfatase dimerization domain-containing protein, partial [Paraburkholderia sp.]|nr:alkyl sulfatase dimerization domain-containing protein [Paraburkholderia sp.]
EMHFFFPQFRALNLAENGTRTLHNVCPLRGTQVRNAQLWSRYLNQSLERYAPHADVVFAQHHWPTWGRERITAYLEQQRDLYKFLHDQTVRMMNQGLTGIEIAERMRLPDSLASQWHARGYYGTVSHNVKAIYQRYLSWYDGNPSNLHALPPEMAGPRYVEYMGGAQAMLERARRDYERGEYRWVAQVMNHLVFADPSQQEARELGAAALEQMGFQAESATWRNSFLLGAQELREGRSKVATLTQRSRDVVCAISDSLFFEYLAVRVDGLKMQHVHTRIAWHFTDTKRHYALNLQNGALTCSEVLHAKPAHVDVTMTRATLNQILGADTTFPEAIAQGQIALDGEVARFTALLEALDRFTGDFNVVEP